MKDIGTTMTRVQMRAILGKTDAEIDSFIEGILRICAMPQFSYLPTPVELIGEGDDQIISFEKSFWDSLLNLFGKPPAN